MTEQSIAENMAFGEKLEKLISRDLKNSAKKAEISKFIEERKDKYKSLLKEKKDSKFLLAKDKDWQ